jgi:hypothetical protein
MARKADHSAAARRIVDEGSSSDGDQEYYDYGTKSKSYLRPRNLAFQVPPPCFINGEIETPAYAAKTPNKLWRLDNVCSVMIKYRLPAPLCKE